MFKQTFLITTPFSFPLDMLRYDEAFPLHQTDAAKIQNSQGPHAEPVTVELARYVQNKSDTPTVERWESYGCAVKVTEIQRVR